MPMKTSLVYKFTYKINQLALNIGFMQITNAILPVRVVGLLQVEEYQHNKFVVCGE